MMKFYVGFFALGTFISGFSTVMAFWAAREFDTDTILLIFALSLAGLTVLQGMTVGGLYNMKKWARNLAIVVLGMGLVIEVLFFSVASLIGIPIKGLVLIWLLNNGHRFDK